MEQRNTYVGKYFKLKTSLKSSMYPNVLAFRLLSLKESGTYNASANCLTVCDGKNRYLNYEVGVLNQNLSLWTYDELRLASYQNDKVVFDLFTETTEEEFNKLLEKTLDKAKNFAD